VESRYAQDTLGVQPKDVACGALANMLLLMA